MKQAIAAILLSALIAPLPVWADGDTSPRDEQDFIVTAYYSPLPDQSVYIRGSYEADRRLNGDGLRGASGHAVYSGMLAGPRSYRFGTKIYLSGLGVGTVDDRGGAIVSASGGTVEHDRIDVWMGSGEEGLARALNFGRRTVHGRIVSDDEADSLDAIDIKNIPVGKIDHKKLRARHAGDQADPNDDPIFDMPIDEGSDVLSILRLEQVLTDIGVYSGPFDGQWTPAVKAAIKGFQIDHGLIDPKDTTLAGYYGPRTRHAMRDAYRAALANPPKKDAPSDTTAPADDAQLRSVVESFGSPRPGEVGPQIRRLQNTLRTLGYFPYKDTAIFGEKTRQALARYQKDHGIVQSGDDSSAGTLSPATRDALASDIIALAHTGQTDMSSILAS